VAELNQPASLWGDSARNISFYSVENTKGVNMSDKPTYEELEQRVRQLEAINSQYARTEKVLLENKKMYNRLVQHSQTGIYIHVGGLLKFVNNRFAQMLGYTPEQIVGRKYWDFVHPADREMVKNISLARARGDPAPTEYEFRHQSKDGKIVWVHNLPIIIHYQGQTANMGNLVQINDRKQAEEALRKSEQFLTEMGSIAKIGGWEHDLITGKVYWTHETYKILEVGLEAAIGLDEYLNFFRSKYRNNLKEAWRLSIESRKRFDLELQAGTSKGRLVWVRVLGQPEYRNGNCVALKGIIQDITDQQKMKALLHQAQKMESIGNLAGGIAHDFNNILSSIIGYTELALDDAAKATPLEENLREVYTAGMRAKDLVQQILAFARQSDEERKPIRVDTIMHEVLKLIRSTIPSTINIKKNIKSNSLIVGNSSQVHQLIMNLCTNAAHAMEDTGGILEAQLQDVEVNTQYSLPLLTLKPGNYIKITISDTGCGIAPDIIHSIFEPYFTTKGVGEGTGMGLALAHGTVTAYDGEITVDSELGKGTIFSIYLPITRKRRNHQPGGEEKLPMGTESILLVDDELTIAKMSSQMLERLGYQVTIRTSSIEALELFRSKSEDFDLVITDMTMPNMTGDELAVKLIALRSDIPVILCTGYSKKLTEEETHRIGIKAFAYKPVVKAEMAKTVRKVLDDAKSVVYQ
jgi:PAS domain S-box-containing protein